VETDEIELRYWAALGVVREAGERAKLIAPART
jgi:hypothetical protein